MLELVEVVEVYDLLCIKVLIDLMCLFLDVIYIIVGNEKG